MTWTEIARAAKSDFQTGRRVLAQADLPEGQTRVRITCSTDDWPVDPDGEVSLRVMYAKDGINFVQVWSDSFSYKRASVRAASQQFECKLEQPFAKSSGIRVDVDAPKTIRTSVVVEVE